MIKAETLANLTELEKELLYNMFNAGYACDNLDDDWFMSWGIDGKVERGVLSSLVKKGIVNVSHWDDGTDPVYLEHIYTKREVASAVGYEL